MAAICEDPEEETPTGYRGGMLGQIMTANLGVADEVNPKKLFFSAIYNAEEVEENGNRIAEIKTYMKEARAKFATGMWDINDDKAWQSYLDTMDKMGLTPYIQGHLCFGDTGTSKGQTILKLMETHNIKDCIYIGDTQGDYKATVEAGIPFIWASYGFGNPDGYTWKIEAFEELLKL